MDDQKVVKETSNLFNTFSSTPILDQSPMKLKPGDYLTHPSVTSIKSRALSIYEKKTGNLGRSKSGVSDW